MNKKHEYVTEIDKIGFELMQDDTLVLALEDEIAAEMDWRRKERLKKELKVIRAIKEFSRTYGEI